MVDSIHAQYRGTAATTSRAPGSDSPQQRASALDDVSQPTVWVLLGQRAGENGQLLSLATALGWPYQVKQLAYNRLHVVPNVLLGSTALNLDRARASVMTAPWPDLILASGKRSVPTARWIRRQAGGATRIVQLGRPRAPLADFDLVVTTPQYRLPARDNVLELALPLNRPDPGHLHAATARWSEQLQKLPRPLIAVMVGGNSWPYVLTTQAARQLGIRANALARHSGGTLLVTTSPRTPRRAADVLFDVIEPSAVTYRWRAGDADNPYLAYLGLADRFIVTGDSASLLVEACSTNKPVQVFRLPRRAFDPIGIARRLAGWRSRLPGHRPGSEQPGWLARLRERLAETGLVTPMRDLDVLHSAVVARGLASWCGEQISAPQRPPTTVADDDLERTVDRVRALFG